MVIQTLSEALPPAFLEYMFPDLTLTELWVGDLDWDSPTQTPEPEEPRSAGAVSKHCLCTHKSCSGMSLEKCTLAGTTHRPTTDFSPVASFTQRGVWGEIYADSIGAYDSGLVTPARSMNTRTHARRVWPSLLPRGLSLNNSYQPLAWSWVP